MLYATVNSTFYLFFYFVMAQEGLNHCDKAAFSFLMSNSLQTPGQMKTPSLQQLRKEVLKALEESLSRAVIDGFIRSDVRCLHQHLLGVQQWLSPPNSKETW